MARIYYKEEKLGGQPIENNIVNVQLFDYIFDNTNFNEFEFQDLEKTYFFGFLKSKKEIFKFVKFRRDGFHYKTSEGNFYLPNSLIFYDVKDAVFPSEFYFIAKINDQIELRKCNGGEEVKWFQIPELHKTVNDLKVFSKIKRTLEEIKKLVETTHNKKIDIEREKKEKEEKQKMEAERPYLNSIQKEAYRKLTKLCVYDHSNKEKILQFIETLKNYDGDSEYETTLNYFMDFLDEEPLNFIMRMDWKAGIEDLEWLLASRLKNNYNLLLDLPKAENYNKRATVSEEQVFKDFDKPLREKGLQLGFIDTQSDEYVVVLHKIKHKEEVEKIIHKIGYNYYEE